MVNFTFTCSSPVVRRMLSNGRSAVELRNRIAVVTTALAKPSLVALYDIRPGNAAGSILTTPEPARGYPSQCLVTIATQVQQAARPLVRPPQYAPATWKWWLEQTQRHGDLDLSTSKWGSLVTRIIGFLPANFQLPMPFRSRLRPGTGKTDRRTDRRRPSTLSALTLWGEGIIRHRARGQQHTVASSNEYR